jgi:hypothetical protein
MLVTTHLLAGAAIGSLVSNLPLAIILAIVSHYSLDYLPHFDQGVFKHKIKKFYFWAAVDFAISGLTLFFLLEYIGYSAQILLVALAAILPDLIDSTPYVSNYLHRSRLVNRIYKFHEQIQNPGKKYIYSFGIIIQVVIVGISVWLLLKY